MINIDLGRTFNDEIMHKIRVCINLGKAIECRASGTGKTRSRLVRAHYMRAIKAEYPDINVVSGEESDTYEI